MTTAVVHSLAPGATHSYSTYLEYLEAIEDTWPEYAGLRKYLKEDSPSFVNPRDWSLSIRDVLSDGSYLEHKSFYFRDWLSWESTEFRALRDTLSSNLDNVRTRFIIAAQARSPTDRLSRRFIDAIGLALDIEPLFFCSLITYPDMAPPRHPNFLKLGSIHFKILKHGLPGSNTVPFCIIVDQPRWRKTYLTYESPDGKPYDWSKSRYLLNETPSLYNQITQHTTPRRRFSGSPLFDIFDQLVCGQKDDSSDIDILCSLSAIIRFQTIQFRTDINSTTHSLWKWKYCLAVGRLRVPDDSHSKSISVEWNRLRSALEGFRSSARASKRFISRNLDESRIPDMLKEARADQEDAQADGEALEQELRDSLRTDVRRLSLEESWRSV